MTMTTKRKSGLIFILITLLIDFIGFGIIIPVLPQLIAELTHGGMGLAAEYGGLLTASYAAVQFICAPVLGGLSDAYGRRPVLLMSLFGLGIDYIFLSFAPSILWLFIGRIIAGVAGASFTTAQAYIADISTPENKAQNFGMIGAAFGVGFIVGPVIGGLCAEFGTRVPFMVSAALALVNWLYGYFILPESLPKEKRRPFSWRRANPVGSLMQIKKYPRLLGLLTGLFLLYLASHSVQSNWSFYTIEKFNWTSKDIGYSLGVVGIVVAIVQGGLIRLAIPKIGAVNAVYLGLFLYIIGFLSFGLATEGWMMYMFMIPYGLGGIAGPAIQGIISNEVPDNAQGEMQGLLTSLMSMASVLGPFIMTSIFAYFIHKQNAIYLPGAPMFLSALLTLAALLIAYFSLKKHLK